MLAENTTSETLDEALKEIISLRERNAFLGNEVELSRQFFNENQVTIADLQRSLRVREFLSNPDFDPNNI